MSPLVPPLTMEGLIYCSWSPNPSCSLSNIFVVVWCFLSERESECPAFVCRPIWADAASGQKLARVVDFVVALFMSALVRHSREGEGTSCPASKLLKDDNCGAQHIWQQLVRERKRATICLYLVHLVACACVFFCLYSGATRNYSKANVFFFALSLARGQPQCVLKIVKGRAR